jgi:hypothetical protein
MQDMLSIPEREYIRQFTEHLEDYLNSLKKIGFEDIGKGVDLFGAGRVSNVKADFELFERNPDMLKKFEEITLNNPIVKFADDQGYFKCANVNTSVFDIEELIATEGSKSSKDSGTKRATAKGKKEKATPAAAAPAKKAKKATKPAPTKAKAAEKPKEVAAPKAKAKAKKTTKPASKAKAPAVEEMVPVKEKARTTTKKKSAKIIPIVDEITERQKLWSKQVENLYKKVQSWAGSQIKNGTFTVHFHPVELADELGRPYKMECLELDTGYSQLVFQPMEMSLLGTVGRIDIYWPDGKLPKITLLLLDVVRNKPFWELWRGTSIDDRQALDKDSFDAMVRDWLD